ncbi:MAG: hypothetical protein IJP14_02635 [Clostridia bacterium]|nr:hypothetical protein [Clostridia bacterium]
MRKLFAIILVISISCMCLGCAPKETYEAAYTSLGAPIENSGILGSTSACVWDLEVYNNTLFVGSGDYDKNHGPIHMWYYDFEKGNWASEDILRDEQISRFHVFDDVLYAPGIDPESSWDVGNYYSYTASERTWETHNVLPGGVHNFDLIKFDGKLFAGLGTIMKDSPIVVSEDGETWEEVLLYKDGQRRETYNSDWIRVYDFFELDGSLYAYFYLYCDAEKVKEIYCYDGEKFVFHSNMIETMQENKKTYVPITQKTEFEKHQYIVNGHLYKTADMITVQKIDVGENVEVADLRKIGNTLYVLCNQEIPHEDGTTEFRISVLKTKDGENMREVFYYTFPVRALSFTYYQQHFYFGMGYGKTSEEYEFHFDNGTVLSVDYTA